MKCQQSLQETLDKENNMPTWQKNVHKIGPSGQRDDSEDEILIPKFNTWGSDPQNSAKAGLASQLACSPKMG